MEVSDYAGCDSAGPVSISGERNWEKQKRLRKERLGRQRHMLTQGRYETHHIGLRVCRGHTDTQAGSPLGDGGRSDRCPG